jgi:hypothetical protein
MKPLFFTIVVAMMIATSALIGSEAQPSHTNASCVPNRPNDYQIYQDGWFRYVGVAVGGTYAALENYDPYVYPYPGSNSSMWVMVSRFNEFKYAQIGWVQYTHPPLVSHPTWKRFTFTQWVKSNGQLGTVLHTDRPPEPIGILSLYTALYNNVPGKFTFQVAGVQLNEQPSAWFVPNQGEARGEIHTLASQMPGGYANFEYAWIYDTHIFYNGSWRSFSGSPHVLPTSAGTHFGWYVLDPAYSIGIFDRRCPD